MATTTTEFEMPVMHVQAKKSLLERVRRECSAGTRLPPIQQLAKQLGMGFNNTHRAVQQLVSEGVLVSRPRLGTFVADPNRVIVEPRSKRIGSTILNGKVVQTCVAGPSTDGFVLRMAAALESHLAEQGCTISRQTFSESNPDFRGTRGIHGFAIFNPSTILPIQCDPQSVVVLASTAALVPVARAGRFDVVTVEQEQSAYLAGLRLREAGCKSLCVVGCQDASDHSLFNLTSVMRLRGLERGWGAAIPAMNLFPMLSHGIYAGAKAAERYLKLNPRPDGVFATSDELAVGFITGTTTHGLQPGRDYDIIGFDRQQIGRGLHGGDLTTIEVPVEQMGKHAALFLADRLLDPDRSVRNLSLGCTLHEGITVRRSNPSVA